MAESFFLKQLELGPLANFVYLLGDPDTREAAVVDPGWQPEVILSEAEKAGYKLTKILLTHTHPDHIGAVPQIVSKTGAAVHVHKKEARMLGLPPSQLAPLDGGDEIRIGGVSLSCLHTPGHTPGSTSFLVRDSVVSGDTLFVGSCGRVDLPGSDPEEMWKSLQRMKQLPDPTVLLPGHNYGATATALLGAEKRSNPFLTAGDVDEFLGFAG